MLNTFVDRKMISTKSSGGEEPAVLVQFYHSQTFTYLIDVRRDEILRRLRDTPEALRQKKLIPYFAPLGETGGDRAWQVFRKLLG